jgi:glycosyltransferase involved in cell wall biosynthesis
LSPAPLVVFGEDWGRHPSSTQHLVGALSARRRVLWVNSVGLRRPRLSDAGRLLAKARAIGERGPARPRDDGPAPAAVMDAPAMPLPGAALARRANRALWRVSVGRRARAMGLDRPILWVSLPTAIDAAAALRPRALVYYCGDDFGALDGVDHAPVLGMERELAAAADLVLVSHPALAAKFDPARTVLVPHGVDLSRFAADGPAPSADPVAGFLGRLDDRLDWRALEAAAEALPDWRFELAGPLAPVATGAAARLAARPNVTLTGPVAPHAVPALLARWRVALLPYRDTPMTRACDPLKLREYLAAGRPVAAFPIAGAAAFAPEATLCAPAELAAAISRAAGRDAPADRAARRARVADADWSARAAQVDALLDALEERDR